MNFPRSGKTERRGRLAAILALRTAAEGADLAIFADIWTHFSRQLLLNA
jgi:hypothetical protein